MWNKPYSHICIGQIEASTCPPPGKPPRHLTFLKIIDQIPSTRAKMPFKCPTLGSIQLIKCPHPGDISQAQKWHKDPTLGTFHRHKNDRRTAETPSVVEQNLYEYNKNWATLLAYLLRTKVSCKAAEIAATRSLNAQLFFVRQHTKHSIKKDPTHWDYYIMTISLTCIIAHLIN